MSRAAIETLRAGYEAVARGDWEEAFCLAHRPGTGFSLYIPLQEASGTETVGEINAVCIGTRPGQREGPNLQGTCSGTADVPEGQLALSVGGEIRQNVAGAIVGGTGKYEGATGTFTSEPYGNGSRDPFKITLP